MTIEKTLLGLAFGIGLIVDMGLDAKAQGTNIVENITNNVTTTLNWKNQYLIKARSGVGGYITTNGVNSEGYVEEGSNVTFYAIPSNGYIFLNWRGTPLTGNATNLSTLTFPVDKAYTNVTAYFKTNAVQPFRGTIIKWCNNEYNQNNEDGNYNVQNFPPTILKDRIDIRKFIGKDARYAKKES